MNQQRPMVEQSLTCDAAHDVGGPRRRHPSDLEQLKAEHERYRKALVRIANAQSGVWGMYAHEALHPRTPLADATAPAPKNKQPSQEAISGE